MKETRFIQQNKDKWSDFENMLKKRKPDVDKIYGLFFSISDDLAFARTHYPNRTVRVYLNNLTRNLFRNVYAGRRFTPRSALQFWKEDLPAALYATRFEQLTAFLVFLVAGLIGMVSCLNDDQFASSILGEDYVRMTLDNIAAGKPMAVYDEQEPLTMFLLIAGNNLKVSFMGFAMGIIGGLGTLYVLLYNGIMVGTFQFFFAKHNLLWDSFLTIWMHGALEISSIVIGSGAGFTIGKGVLFPGTYSRLQSLLLSSRRAIIIMIGISPIILVAAFIESFLTRYYTLPMPIKLALILASFGFMLFYFVVYPLTKGKKVEEEKVQSDGLTYLKIQPFEPTRIYNAGQISGFTLQYFGSVLGKTFWHVLMSAFLYIGAVFAWRNLVEDTALIRFGSGLWALIFSFSRENSLLILHVFLASALVVHTLYRLKQILPTTEPRVSFLSFLRQIAIPVLVQVLAISMVVVLESPYEYFMMLVLPLIFVWQGLVSQGQRGFTATIGKSWDFTFDSLMKCVLAFAFFWVMGAACIVFVSSTLMEKAFDLIYWNFSDQEGLLYDLTALYLPALIGYLVVLFMMQCLAISSFFLASSLIESNEAPHLLHRIRTLQQE